MYKELILVVGLPASGKSTYCKEIKDRNSIIINPDNFRRVFTGNEYVHKLEGYTKGIVKNTIKVFSYDDSIQKIYLDESAWLINKQRRKEWIRFGEKLGFKVVCYYRSEDFEVCLTRNNERTEQRIIPKFAMDLLWEQFEPPNIDEGFSFLKWI